MADTREILLKLIGRETVSGEARKAARGLKDMGDAADDAARDAKGLDRALIETHRSLQRLKDEARKSDDPLSFTRDINKQQRNLNNLKKLFSDAGDDSATGFAARLQGKLGPLVTRMPVAPWMVGAVAAASPAIGAAVSAAVLGGLAGGTVALGVAAAFRDPRVKAEGERTAAFLGAVLTNATRSFVPATIEAMKVARGEITKLGPVLGRIGDRAATFVLPLTRAITDLVSGTLPGIESGLRKAAPVIRALESGARGFGDAIGDAVDAIGDGASGAAVLLSDLLTLTSQAVRNIGVVVGTLSKVYGIMRLATAPNKGELLAEMVQGEVAAGQYETALRGLANSLSGVGTDAEQAAAEVAALKTEFDRLFGVQMDLDRAAIAYKEGLKELKAELTEGKRTLDLNTQAGRDNRSAILDQIDIIKQNRAARIEHNNEIDTANAKYGKELESLRKTLLQMGYNKAQVDALIGAYKRIPATVNTTVKADTHNAIEAAKRLRQYLANIPDEVINVAMRVTGNTNPSAVAAGIRKQYAFSHGGMVSGGTPGRDSVDAKLMPGEGVLTVEGVKRLGGPKALEAINSGRAIAAARGSASGGMGGGGMSITIQNLSLPSVTNPVDFVRALQRYTKDNGPIRGVSFA